jgi:hypothetical protein
MTTQGTSAWSEQLKDAKKHGLKDESPYGRAMQQLAVTEAQDKAFEDKVHTLADLVLEAGLRDANILQIGASLSDLAASYREAESKRTGSGRPALLTALKNAGVERLAHRQALASALVRARNRDCLLPAKDDEEAVQFKAKSKEKFEAAFAERAASENAKLEAAFPHSATAAGFEPLVDGTVVMIFGLLSRPDLNGREGIVDGYKADGWRYTIDVKGEIVALQPKNVKLKENFRRDGHG